MFCELKEKNTGWRRVVKNHLSNLLLYLMRAEEEEVLQIKEVGKESLNITRLLEYIRRNYQVITLKDLSKDFHYHENYLSRVIKQHCQMNFRELLCQIRLKEAEKLLSDTKLPVTQIAARIGYQKPNFFFKSFKEHYNITPTEFRHLYRKK
jgi:YesN/AraC family two-component response regulator